MKIKVNGKDQVLEKSDLSITDLLVLNSVKNPEMVSVQLNDEFIARDEFEKVILKNDDVIDFLYFMGGGQDSFENFPIDHWLVVAGFNFSLN